MERIEVIIGRLLLAGVLISLSLVVIGIIIYLIKHGHEVVSYRIFHGEPQYFTTISGILQDSLTLSGRGFIQLGLLSLLIVQILRVALTAWYFAKLKDQVFVWISLFILAILLYSTFWRF